MHPVQSTLSKKIMLCRQISNKISSQENLVDLAWDSFRNITRFFFRRNDIPDVQDEKERFSFLSLVRSSSGDRPVIRRNLKFSTRRVIGISERLPLAARYPRKGGTKIRLHEIKIILRASPGRREASVPFHTARIASIFLDRGVYPNYVARRRYLLARARPNSGSG